ncbi:hypothetical protein L1887_48244 [Cichorium endivia]|nr:hypothetical protein L1887_48244 [Cichorium endivia]
MDFAGSQRGYRSLSLAKPCLPPYACLEASTPRNDPLGLAGIPCRFGAIAAVASPGAGAAWQHCMRQISAPVLGTLLLVIIAASLPPLTSSDDARKSIKTSGAPVAFRISSPSAFPSPFPSPFPFLAVFSPLTTPHLPHLTAYSHHTRFVSHAHFNTVSKIRIYTAVTGTPSE